jgi:hypothetical protein
MIILILFIRNSLRGPFSDMRIFIYISFMHIFLIYFMRNTILYDVIKIFIMSANGLRTLLLLIKKEL